MPPPDSSGVLNALVAKLGTDPALLALMPNGVYEDLAPPGAKRFVIVSEITSFDVPVFGGRAFEDGFYLVEARALVGSTVPEGDVRAAALRIDAMLEDGDLTVEGFGLMTMHREEFVRGLEVDEIDRSIRWKRRGGRYRVQVAVGVGGGVAPIPPTQGPGSRPDLGGSDNVGIVSADWVAVVGRRRHTFTAADLENCVAAVLLSCRTDDAATSVQLRLRDLTAVATVATGTASTSTDVVDEMLAVTLLAGHTYELEIVGGNASNAVFGWGYLRLTPE